MAFVCYKIHSVVDLLFVVVRRTHSLFCQPPVVCHRSKPLPGRKVSNEQCSR